MLILFNVNIRHLVFIKDRFDTIDLIQKSVIDKNCKKHK